MLALAAVGFALALTVGTYAFSGGPKAGGAVLDPSGCNCHGVQAAATAITFTGVPAAYEAGKAYDVEVSSTSDVVPAADPANNGGFHLQFSKGTIAARGTTQGSWIQTGSTYAEHTKTGEEQNVPAGGVQKWQLTWTAPSSGDVVFKLWVNRVDGDASPSGDKWNTVSMTAKGPAEEEDDDGGKSPGLAPVVAILALAGVGLYLVRRR